MKTLFLALLLSISSTLYSQDVVKIIRKAAKYYLVDKYDEALKLALQADSILKEEDNIYDLTYTYLMTLTGSIYVVTEHPERAEFYYKKSLEIYNGDEELQDNLEFINTLNSFGAFLISEERYTEAKPLLEEALQKLKEGSFKKTEDEDAFALEQMGELLLKMGEYKESEFYLENSLNTFKDKSDEFYISGLKAMGELKLKQRLYNESISFYNEMLSKTKKKYGEKSNDYLTELLELGSVYSEMSDFNSAILITKDAVDKANKSKGPKSEEYSYCLDQLASIYIEMGNYTDAESVLKNALDIQSSGGFDRTVTLHNLANLYTIRGDFATSDKLISELLSIDEKEGKESGAYYSDQNLQANLYTLMGSYDKALVLYKYLAEKDKIDGELNNPDYATALANIANLYEIMGKSGLAEPYTLESYKIYKATLGESHPLYANVIDQLVRIYSDKGDYPIAELYCKQAIEIYRKTVGEKHEDYAGSLMHLAEIYIREGKYPISDSLLNKTVSIVKDQFGVSHPMYANSLMSLAELYVISGKEKEAEPVFMEVNKNLDNQIKDNFSFMAEKEKEQFIASVNRDFEEINSFIFRRRKMNPAISSVSYDNMLKIKGIVLQSSKAIRQAALNSNDSGLIKLYDKFYQNRQLLSKISLQTPTARLLNADSLEALCIQEEKELNERVKLIPGFQNFSEIGNPVKWNDVEKALAPGEAAIEFISFPTDFNNENDTNLVFCALVLKSGFQHPEFVYLTNEAELTSLFKEAKSATDELTAAKLYLQPTVEPSKLPSDNGNKLYKLIWEPIESLLSGVKTIYYSPTGLLCKISFDAIPADGKNYLSDKYSMNQVLSTRAVLNKGNDAIQIRSTNKPVIYGGIDYDSDTTTMKSAATRYVTNVTQQRGQFTPGDMTRGGGFNYLDGTLSEIIKIDKLFSENKVNTVTFRGNEATEESFKSLNNSNSPVFLHIATHGFFFPEPIQSNKPFSVRNKANAFVSAENPLLRSGLIFAGANHAWKNQQLPSGIEDGILLAFEVAEMYLPNTKLVVLSACETGLGDIKGNEGVFGLQRAFKMAGVKYLINSLWQVPDYQTSELMGLFYENWLSGFPIRDSFRKAQINLKQKYPGNPFAWGAFVLVE